MAAIAAFVAVAGGYGAKPSRVQRAELALSKAQVGSHEAENAYRQLKAALHEQEAQMKKLNTMKGAKLAAKMPVAKKLSKLDEEAPAEDAAPEEDAAPSEDAPVEEDEAATDSGERSVSKRRGIRARAGIEASVARKLSAAQCSLFKLRLLNIGV